MTIEEKEITKEIEKQNKVQTTIQNKIKPKVEIQTTTQNAQTKKSSHSRSKRKKISEEKIQAKQVENQENNLLNDLETTLRRLQTDIEVIKHENEVKEQKLSLLERENKASRIGEQQYGEGPWYTHVNGKEKGYKRSIYIDINTMFNSMRGFN